MLRTCLAAAIRAPTKASQGLLLSSRRYASEKPTSDNTSPDDAQDPLKSAQQPPPLPAGGAPPVGDAKPPSLEGNPDLLAMLQDAGEAPARPTKATGGGYKSTADRKRERMANVFLGIFLLGALGGAAYLASESADSEIKGYTPGAIYERLKERFTGQVKHYTEPAFAKLLPDPLPEPYQRRYTLVLDLDDLLIHSDWSREYGWRTAKRPGLDYFLSYLSQYYEIVVFTNQYAGTALPIVQKLDPYRSSLSATLFRESARYEDGKFIKDLSYMNRALERVILMDTNKDAASAQPENAIILEPWKGDVGPSSNAKELLSHLPFLEYLAAVEVDDVRQALRSYQGKHIPTEYMERENALRQQIAESRKTSRSTGFFGGKPKAGKEAPVEIFMDQQRKRAQAAHKEYMQYLKDNGAKMLAEEKAKEAEMMAGMKTSIVGWLGSSGQPPTSQPEQPAARQN
ncbi:HAD-like domain-containing protein [Protomyces lactucae-debilis]|uniref:Mitochondrial import inner membrane translocase subunit TIM50 n=1 Tax=Protomyces lactucae-debilis TaxID=2754530 RepID=A0A1Y2F945_PROLT|nr:HAD-like domain-containing protein [Protomyces lactucae-debilis]ORY80438.1 HAD-like domain-containing protein [Protomyces lactucae-debilis]